MTYVPYHRDGHVFDGRLVRSTVCPYECVAGEEELSQATSPVGAFREAEVSGLRDFPHVDEPANPNLVPWMSLPRRAQHRNEQARLFR
ncbi:hypothetical protein [Microvirga sp. BSC39]|uniref:hypothetical protein n=1 Tax=Microvirga sp. BSC39 TaxID=1549810 RepID=UPI0004E97749|nr:hypothetical protein [Microvirga sp. BSC39]KFG70270.1 hypothetical protein JH26_05595 [Microvirga sp. BSC39]